MFEFLITWQFLVVVSLLIISGIAKAVQDTLNFHFDKSIFKHIKNKQFWDSSISWLNKYEDRNVALGFKKIKIKLPIIVWKKKNG